MIINMTTIALRKKHYIDETLESLLRSDGRHIPVNLILGSSDTSHVETYRKRLNLVLWDEEAEAQARAGKMRHNCNVNAIRALKYGDSDHCLCCEDDITFDENWFSQLSMTIAEIGDTDYVLNLGQGRDQSPDTRYATHAQPHLCGAQAIFYPSKALRSAVAAYLEANIAKATNDTLIGRYAKQYASLYNATPVLVRHIGHVSSFHQPTPPVKRAEVERRISNAAKTPVEPSAVVGRRDGSRSRSTSETLVALLRASLGSGPLPETTHLAQSDWRSLATLATHHGLVPVVYRALSDRAAGVPPEWLKRLKAQYVNTVFRGQLAQTGVEEIGAAFESERIPVLVMEGAALLYTLYDDPGLRVVDDIDLLVDEGDIERAGTRLQDIGLRLIGSDSAHRHGPPSRIHLAYRRQQPQSIPVRLHVRLFEPYKPYVFDLDAALAQARPLSGLPPNVRVMAPEHELTHLCLQLDRRAVTYRSLISQEDWLELLLLPRGPGRLLGLYDIALYLQKRNALIDWDSFVSTARRCVIDGHLHAPLELCRRAFGIGPSAGVLRGLNRSRPRLVERLAHGLCFASDRSNEMHRSGAASTRRSRLLARWSTRALRFAHTWISIFPPRAYVQARYPAIGAPLASRVRHVREVIPRLWAEARYRLRSAAQRY
jgi:hypothetical protein